MLTVFSHRAKFRKSFSHPEFHDSGFIIGVGGVEPASTGYFQPGSLLPQAQCGGASTRPGRPRPGPAGGRGAGRGAAHGGRTCRRNSPSMMGESVFGYSKSTFRQIVRNGIRHSVAQTGSRPGFLEAGTVHSSRWLPIKQVSLHEHRLARPEFKSFARLFKVPREAKLQIGSILGNN